MSLSMSMSSKDHPHYKTRIRDTTTIFQRSLSSTNSNDNNETENAKDATTKKQTNKSPKKKSLRDTLNDIHQKENTSFTNGGGGGDSSEFLYQASTAFDSFKSTLGETWNDLLNSNQPKDINKKMHESKAGDVSQDDNEAADKYEGTTAMMIIDETEN